MTTLPDEIWTDVLDYLDPPDLITSQRISPRLLKLARDSSLWRNKVYEKAPSAARSHAANPNALSALTGALGGLSLGESPPSASVPVSQSTVQGSRSGASERAKAVLEWDGTHSSEKFDWYSEYIARHAPLSTEWAEISVPNLEVRGVALFANSNKVIGPLEDGSLAIWNVQESQQGRRTLLQLGKSRERLLFEDMYSLGESSIGKRSRPLGAAVDNISIDSKRMRAFVAVENVLNEVDLEKMEVVAQSKFAWPITSLSQETDLDHDLTVGTSFSLHIHDQRMPCLKLTDATERLDGPDDSNIAFLQNWTKGHDMRLPEASSETFVDCQFPTNKLEAYARIEPGPQSIVHHGQNEIIIAGRMPSILFYDRRTFPQPRTAIHSGARLAAMATLPVPPARSDSTTTGNATLITCGEYGGRGSLEIYELPWDKKTSSISMDRTPTQNGTSSPFREPFSSRNRQEASSSKLLSVATQGSRIVFSDSEGMVKWVERDGYGLARRWNINSFQLNASGASISGDKVVRKMVAFPEQHSEQGTRGDGDLLVWTGEKIGIVTTKPTPWDDHDELVQAFERGMDLTDREKDSREQEAEYSNMMRRALERQADERRWMSRFGGRRW